MCKVYVCVDSFVLGMVDDNGFTIEDKVSIVPKNSIWAKDEDKYRIIGGEIRLQRIKDNTIEWIEISQETFENHFEIGEPFQSIK